MAKKKRMIMKVALPRPSAVARRLGVDERGDVQKYVTREVLRRIKPYIPLKEGTLRGAAAILSPTKIVVDAPYAKAQFFGVTREGKPFKYRHTGAKVGSHWDRRLAAEQGGSIVADATKYARRKRW